MTLNEAVAVYLYSQYQAPGKRDDESLRTAFKVICDCAFTVIEREQGRRMRERAPKT